MLIKNMSYNHFNFSITRKGRVYDKTVSSATNATISSYGR